jgi:hypothetical protein
VLTKLTDAAGLAVATARFSLHKEYTLRLVSALCGSRFSRGVVVVGGVTALPRLPGDRITAELDRLQHAVKNDVRASTCHEARTSFCIWLILACWSVMVSCASRRACGSLPLASSVWDICIAPCWWSIISRRNN